MVQPNSLSMRSMVAAAGGASAVMILMPGRTLRRISSGALARKIITVGAAHITVILSLLMRSKAAFGSTFGRQTCVAPTAVTVHTYVQPLAWNIGSVQRYRSVICMGRCRREPTTLRYAL